MFSKAILAPDVEIVQAPISRPTFDQIDRLKMLVVDSVNSQESKRAYDRAITDFLLWCSTVGPGTGFTKATGVRELMTHEPFKGRRPLFIGDDITDETVFEIMPDFDGLAFSVGRRAQGIAGHFDSPNDVRNFLAQLLLG